MMDIEKRKVAALKLFNSWIKSPSCVGYVNEEYIETIRELLQPSPSKQPLSALLKGITPENCHDAAWEGAGVAGGEVDEAIKKVRGSFELKEIYEDGAYDALETLIRAAQQPRQSIAFVIEETCVGPRLLFAGITVQSWLGTMHNDEAHNLAKVLNNKAQQPRQEWMTMDTMPKPYPSSIILVTNGKGTWPATYTYGADGDGFYECGLRYGRIKGVTHWQPLPSPPKETR